VSWLLPHFFVGRVLSVTTLILEKCNAQPAVLCLLHDTVVQCMASEGYSGTAVSQKCNKATVSYAVFFGPERICNCCQ
jgi:hypothetical protein